MRLLHSSQVSPAARVAEVQAALGSVSEARLREWVARISIPRHYRAQRESNQTTAAWLAAQFHDWGYVVETQGPLQNIIALPHGHQRELTLVGAHYDSVPQTPGADDNGSAVAAMLGCAEACAKFARTVPVCFVAFNCEEDGMAGSGDFVANHLPHADFKIKQAHILEMVGFASYQPGSQELPTGLPRFPRWEIFWGCWRTGCPAR
jgi:Zn-dependent M28 family amino/carboxypeptidase